jgi:catechol 2,3-dioxygenase-like lactoylglutathione lyase family enzyme
MIKFVHTNIITNDWRKLADFYIQVLNCKPLSPERDLRGEWLDKSTGILNAHIVGVHLLLPGYGENSPTLEIFQYDQNDEKLPMVANRKGFGHIAFQVDDVKETLVRLLEHGGTQLGELVITEIKNAGIINFVYAQDIDGNIIELQSWEK